MTRIGSLFSGFGGLDVAVQSVLGGQVAWHAEIDPAACRVLAARFPGVPNLGDVTNTGWHTLRSVDVLIGGFPCQDISGAGQRAGMRDGNRSGLWAHMAYAVDMLRPPLVVIENVRGLLSARADSEMEWCPGCMGDLGGEPPMRALGAVLGDLATLGYDAQWCSLRAADVGAPHGRARIFAIAWPATADPRHRAEPERPRGARGEPGQPVGGGPAGAVQDTGGSPRRQRGQSAARQAAGGWPHPDPRRRGGTPVADPGGPRRQGPRREGPTQRRGEPHRAADATTEPRPVAPADTDSGRRQRDPQLYSEPHRPEADDEHGRRDTDRLGVAYQWGSYEPAIRRWEHRLGRAAPAPVVAGTRGQPRLSPAFVEWLMGLDAGWVTAVPGLTYSDQLRLLGNGVVPQQAAAALRWLLAARAQAEAS